LNLLSNGGATPLHFAIRNNRDDVVRALLDAKAMIEAKFKTYKYDNNNSAYDTPLTLAIRHHSVQCAIVLYDRGADLKEWKSTVPSWLEQLIQARAKRIRLVVLFIGVHRFRRSCIAVNNDINVIRLIGKHMVSYRLSMHDDTIVD
jgi:ankyrin repeat protein